MWNDSESRNLPLVTEINFQFLLHLGLLNKLLKTILIWTKPYFIGLETFHIRLAKLNRFRLENCKIWQLDLVIQTMHVETNFDILYCTHRVVPYYLATQTLEPVFRIRIWIRSRLDPHSIWAWIWDPDPHSESGFRIQMSKNIYIKPKLLWVIVFVTLSQWEQKNDLIEVKI